MQQETYTPAVIGRITKRKVLAHVLAWVLYISIGVMKNVFTRKGYVPDVLNIIMTQLPAVFTFYGAYIIYIKYSGRKMIGRLLLAHGTLFILYAIFAYFIGFVAYPLLETGSADTITDIPEFLASSVWVFLIYSFFGYAYYSGTKLLLEERMANTLRENNFKLEQEKLRLQKANLQKEQEHLKSQHDFLKAQINSHFLHNTLNFFYSRSLPLSAELSEGILILSDIMRYSLQHNEDPNGKVLLTDEIRHMKNVIKINQLRFSNKLKIEFSISGDTENVRIVPLILITLIENALKHGELNDERFPLRIGIVVDKERQSVVFRTTNRKKTGPKELSHGIGLENTRRRLKSSYGDKFQLTLRDEDPLFHTELTLPVHSGGISTFNADTNLINHD